MTKALDIESSTESVFYAFNQLDPTLRKDASNRVVAKIEKAKDALSKSTLEKNLKFSLFLYRNIMANSVDVVCDTIKKSVAINFSEPAEMIACEVIVSINGGEIDPYEGPKPQSLTLDKILNPS